MPLLIQSPPKGFTPFEEMYEAQNLARLLMGQDTLLDVKIITEAPEIVDVLDAVPELDQCGIVFSIGHRFVDESRPPYSLLTKEYTRLVTRHRTLWRKAYGVVRALLSTSFIIRLRSERRL